MVHRCAGPPGALAHCLTGAQARLAPALQPTLTRTPPVPLFHSYPNQMLEIFVRMYLYRWHKPTTPGGSGYSQISLEVRTLCDCA